MSILDENIEERCDEFGQQLRVWQKLNSVEGSTDFTETVKYIIDSYQPELVDTYRCIDRHHLYLSIEYNLSPKEPKIYRMLFLYKSRDNDYNRPNIEIRPRTFGDGILIARKYNSVSLRGQIQKQSYRLKEETFRNDNTYVYIVPDSLKWLYEMCVDNLINPTT